MFEPAVSYVPSNYSEGFARQPLYSQVRQHLLKELARGVWRAGDMLPAEKELAQKLGVSLGTVRKAIASLADEGVLCRKQGLGTFVQSFRMSAYTNQFHRFFYDKTNDIVPFTMRLVRYETVAAEEATVAAEVLGLSPEARLIHALRVYSWMNEDVGISELWLPAERFSRMTQQNLASHEGSLYSYYETELGVTIVDTHDCIKAQCFTWKQASIGRFQVGAPYLELTRIGYTYGNEPVEYRLSYCSSEKFHMVM